MATTLNLGTSTYYAGGVSGANAVVGWESSRNRVFRVSFTAPKEGANHLSFKFGRHGFGGGSVAPLHFYIGTSDTSHANAGADAEYHGIVTMAKQSDNTYISSGEVDILLLPNKTYYLWIFPGSTTYGWFYWYRSVSEAYSDGAAGVIRIKEGDQELVLIPTVKENGAFVSLAATVKDGENLKYFG